MSKKLLNNLRYDDPEVWKLFEEGKTKGIFQLESNLGKSWSKKLAPENIEQLSALVAILRPGSLKACLEDGKSITQHYVDRRHNREAVDYIDDSCKDILEPTLGLMLYQEQTMQISTRVAGFSGVEADKLRKAIGKKKADLMQSLRSKFIDGCEKTGIVTKEKGEEIFDIIEKSARYQFNKSHSVSYAETAFWTAYAKQKHPIEFFTSYLEHSGEKQDKKEEISELISEARLFNIEVKICDITNFGPNFFMDKKNSKIYFGLKDIKSLTGKNGDKCIEILNTSKEKVGKDFGNYTWMDILLHLSDEMVSTNFKNLCTVGFFSTIKNAVTRTRALYEFDIYKKLSPKEKEWISQNYPLKKWDSLLQCLIDLRPTKKEGGGTSNINRKNAIGNEIALINSPPYELDKDDPSWIISEEEKILGCSISLSKFDAGEAMPNVTCDEVSNGVNMSHAVVCGTIEKIKLHTIKKEGVNFGREMAFLTVKDDSGILDSVILFPDIKDEYRFSLFEGNNILIKGSTRDTSLIVQEIKDI